MKTSQSQGFSEFGPKRRAGPTIDWPSGRQARYIPRMTGPDPYAFRPWDSAQKMVLPDRFIDSLAEAIGDIDFFLSNEASRWTLVRGVLRFRKLNNLSQRELAQSLNLGFNDLKLVRDFESDRLAHRKELLLYLTRLREFAQDMSGFVSWVDVSHDRASFHIDRLRDSLIKAIEAIRQLNDDPAKPVFSSAAAKQQLLAILKAAVAELEGPKVDRGRLMQVVKALGGFCSKVASAGASKVLGDALADSAQKGSELLGRIRDLPGIDLLDF